jgi:hypothetical protein
MKALAIRETRMHANNARFPRKTRTSNRSRPPEQQFTIKIIHPQSASHCFLRRALPRVRINPEPKPIMVLIAPVLAARQLRLKSLLTSLESQGTTISAVAVVLDVPINAVAPVFQTCDLGGPVRAVREVRAAAVEDCVLDQLAGSDDVVAHFLVQVAGRWLGGPEDVVWKKGRVGVEVAVSEVGVEIPSVGFVAAKGGGGSREGCQERGEGWDVEQHVSYALEER